MTTRRLSLADSNHLQMETTHMHMHVAALMIFQAPADAGPDFIVDLMQQLRACKDIGNPWNYRLRRSGRLQLMPLLEELETVDLDYHLRHSALPYPGGERELGQLISRLHSQKLDQRKPLWEAHLIEGLQGGRFAVYLKIHHALADGVSATKILARGLSSEPGRPLQAWWSAAHTPPVPAANSPARAWPNLPRPQDLLGVGKQLFDGWFGQGEDDVCLRKVPKTPFNQQVFAQRRVATQSSSLARIKAVAKAADATVNDVVLCLIGGVIRDYLKRHGELPRESLAALIPVSLHTPGDSRIGNNIAQIIASLGTHIAEPDQRLAAVKTSTRAARARLQAIPKNLAPVYSHMLIAPFSLALVSGQAGRSRPVFNVVVSNVIGPAQPLYLGDAQMTQLYPISVPMDGAALNVTCFSYNGSLNFGFTACRDSLPQMQQMAVDLETELSALEQALSQ